MNYTHYTHYAHYELCPLYPLCPLCRLPCQGGSKAPFRVNNAKLMLNRHKVLIIIIIFIKNVFGKKVLLYFEFCSLDPKQQG